MRSGLALILGLLTVWLAAGGPLDGSVGTDDAAVRQVQAIAPAYRPWYRSPWSVAPGQADAGLAGQAVAGLLVFVFATRRLRAARRADAPAARD